MKKYGDVNEMRRLYKKISVPRELEDKVNDSLERANLNTKKKIHSKTVIWRTLALTTTAVLAFVLLVNVNANAALAMEKIPFLGRVVKVVSFREYQDVQEEGDVQADIRIPTIGIEGGQDIDREVSEELNQKIREYTDAIIRQYEEEVKRLKGSGSKEEAESAKYSVFNDYEVVTDNDRLFSICIHTEVAMAGTNSYIKIYHVDKKSGKMITLRDLFKKDADYVGVISKVIKSEMRRQMREDPAISYFLDDEIEDWNFKEISPEANFYVDGEGKLTIVFDKYEVAPGCMGMVEFSIPYEEIEDIASEGYLE